MRDDFAIMIVTHGRPDKQDTLKMFQRMGYSRNIFLVVDNMDPTIKQLPECSAIVFDKKEAAQHTDTMFNMVEMKSPVYGMNAALDKAREMGLRYVVICDDDLKFMQFRPLVNGKLKYARVKNAESMIEAIIRYMESGRIKALCPARADGYVGGANSQYVRAGVKYNLSQMIFVDTAADIRFRGTLYVDLISSLDMMIDKRPSFAVMNISVQSPGEGTNDGGCKNLYDADATRYVAKYYALMAHPDCVRIAWSKKKKQFVHRIGGVSSHPFIISQKWQKERDE